MDWTSEKNKINRLLFELFYEKKKDINPNFYSCHHQLFYYFSMLQRKNIWYLKKKKKVVYVPASLKYAVFLMSTEGDF